MKRPRRRLPRRLRWLFWNLDFEGLDLERHADDILARILEHGGMSEVRWALGRYGAARIHRFFRTVGHPDVSERTRAFWRAVFHAEDERWPRPAAWRQDSSALWIA